MKQTSRALAQRARYRFDTTISRGTLPVIGYLALLTFALVFSAALVLAITGTAINEDEHPGLGEAFWQSLLRILDPGTFSGDNGWVLRVVMLIVTLIGISIAAVLIGLIASGIEQRIELLRRGRSAVVETGHTLILGWSPRMHTVVSELCIANENQRRPAIVVLANENKQEMEDDLAGRIGDTKGTRVVCRTGDPASLHDLRMASAGVGALDHRAGRRRGGVGRRCRSRQDPSSRCCTSWRIPGHRSSPRWTTPRRRGRCGKRATAGC